MPDEMPLTTDQREYLQIARRMGADLMERLERFANLVSCSDEEHEDGRGTALGCRLCAVDNLMFRLPGRFAAVRDEIDLHLTRG